MMIESVNLVLSKSQARLLLFGITTLAAAFATEAGAAESIPGVQVQSSYWPTRGTAARVLIMSPPQSQTGVILLPGGHGNINLDVQAQIGWGLDDFAIRTRASYARAGLTTVIPDIPIDRKPPAAVDGYRRSEAEASDLGALASALGGMVKQVFIVAYDRGVTSALNAAARHKVDSIAGLALISPILEPAQSADAPALEEGARRAVANIPVLMISHRLDKCSIEAVTRLNAAASGPSAGKFRWVPVTGGSDEYRLDDPFAYYRDPCNKDAHHALAGLEARVSSMIIEWLHRPSVIP
jgi:hypothetical protein